MHWLYFYLKLHWLYLLPPPVEDHCCDLPGGPLGGSSSLNPTPDLQVIITACFELGVSISTRKRCDSEGGPQVLECQNWRGDSRKFHPVVVTLCLGEFLKRAAQRQPRGWTRRQSQARHLAVHPSPVFQLQCFCFYQFMFWSFCKRFYFRKETPSF